MLVVLAIACRTPPSDGGKADADTGRPPVVDTSATTMTTRETAGDSGPPEDTAPPRDTGTTMPAPCVLEEPWAVGSWADADVAWGLSLPNTIVWGGIEAELRGYAEDLGCPTVTEDGDTTTLEGDCTVGDVTVVGRLTSTLDGTLTLDGFEFWDGGRHAAGQGTMTIAAYEPWAFDLTSTFEGFGETNDGTYTQRGTNVCAGEEGAATCVYDVYSYVRDAPDGVTGDYCYRDDFTQREACDGGWDGTTTLIGDHVLVATFDSADCDGCGDVTIDEVPAGTTCE